MSFASIRSFTSALLRRNRTVKTEQAKALLDSLPHRQHVQTSDILLKLPNDITTTTFSRQFHQRQFTASRLGIIWRLQPAAMHIFRMYVKAMRRMLQLAHHIDYHRICLLHKRDAYGLYQKVYPKIYPNQHSRQIYLSNLDTVSRKLSKQETKHWRFLISRLKKQATNHWRYLARIIPRDSINSIRDLLTLYAFNQWARYDQSNYEKFRRRHNIYPDRPYISRSFRNTHLRHEQRTNERTVSQPASNQQHVQTTQIQQANQPHAPNQHQSNPLNAQYVERWVPVIHNMNDEDCKVQHHTITDDIRRTLSIEAAPSRPSRVLHEHRFDATLRRLYRGNHIPPPPSTTSSCSDHGSDDHAIPPFVQLPQDTIITTSQSAPPPLTTSAIVAQHDSPPDDQHDLVTTPARIPHCSHNQPTTTHNSADNHSSHVQQADHFNDITWNYSSDSVLGPDGLPLFAGRINNTISACHSPLAPQQASADSSQQPPTPISVFFDRLQSAIDKQNQPTSAMSPEETPAASTSANHEETEEKEVTISDDDLISLDNITTRRPRHPKMRSSPQQQQVSPPAPWVTRKRQKTAAIQSQFRFLHGSSNKIAAIILQDEANKIAPDNKLKVHAPDFIQTSAIQSLCMKGRGFVPVPLTVDFHDLHVALFNWINKIRHRYFVTNLSDKECPEWLRRSVLDELHNADYEIKENWSDFYGNKVETRLRTWRCPQTSNLQLESYITAMRTAVLRTTMYNQRTKPVALNLTDDELHAIETIQNDHDHIFLEEDKGSNFSVVSTTDFVSSMTSTIMKSNFVPIAAYDLLTHKQEIDYLLDHWYKQGEIKDDWLRKLRPRHPVSYFYGPSNNFAMHKTHKPGNKKPVRVISSSTGTISAPINIYSTHHLMPLWQNQDFLIRDTKAFLLEMFELNQVISPDLHTASNSFADITTKTVLAVFYENYILRIHPITKAICTADSETKLNQQLVSHLQKICDINKLDLNLDSLPSKYYNYVIAFLRCNRIEAVDGAITATPDYLPYQLFDYRRHRRIQIFSFDVQAMYPSMAHDFCIKMVDYHWDRLAHKLPQHPSKESIKSFLWYSLKNIISEFNGQHYRKTAGIGQGEDYAAQLADIAISYHGYFLHDRDWLSSVTNMDLFYAGNYRDDGINIGNCTYADIIGLLNGLNGLVDDIDFTLDIEYGGLSCKFLDLRLYLTVNGIITESYSKPTDDHIYLDPTSNHPTYMYAGIIQGIAMRIRALNNDAFIERNMYLYKCYLIKRGYPVSTVNAIFYKYGTMTQEQCLRKWHPSNYRSVSTEFTMEERKAHQLERDDASRQYYTDVLAANKRIMHERYRFINDSVIKNTVKLLNHHNTQNPELSMSNIKATLFDPNTTFTSDQYAVHSPSPTTTTELQSNPYCYPKYRVSLKSTAAVNDSTTTIDTTVEHENPAKDGPQKQQRSFFSAKLYLTRIYHPLHADFYALHNEYYDTFIAGDKRLSLLFPKSDFKPSWKRDKTLAQILAPHKYRPHRSLSFTQSVLQQFVGSCQDTDDSNIIIWQNRRLRLNKIRQWKGFETCADLEKAGILIPNTRGRKCHCFTTQHLLSKKTKWEIPALGIVRKIKHRLTCFSRNVIYVSPCRVCDQQYYGKCSQGTSGNRTFRMRDSEHCRGIINLYRSLQTMGFYGSDGHITVNLQHRAQILNLLRSGLQKQQRSKSAKHGKNNTKDITLTDDDDEYFQSPSSFSRDDIDALIRKIASTTFHLTGDVAHCVGLDGSSCYASITGNDPLSIYSSFPIETVRGSDLNEIQARLQEREQWHQSANCSIYTGLNGTNDWNNIGIYTRDYTPSVQPRFDADGRPLPSIPTAIREKLENSIQEAATITFHDLPFPDKALLRFQQDLMVRCPNGHQLILFTLNQLQVFSDNFKIHQHDYDTGAACDDCNDDILRCHDPIYHCILCRYDRCSRCYHANRNTITAPYSQRNRITILSPATNSVIPRSPQSLRAALELSTIPSDTSALDVPPRATHASTAELNSFIGGILDDI